MLAPEVTGEKEEEKKRKKELKVAVETHTRLFASQVDLFRFQSDRKNERRCRCAKNSIANWL